MTTRTSLHDRPAATVPRPGPGARLAAHLAVLMCLGFAGANVLLIVNLGRLGAESLQGFGAGLVVMNVLVLVLKLVGAAVAGLSVARSSSRVRPTALSLLLWGAFTTLLVYVVGALAEAVAMLSGFLGGADRIDARSVGYLAFFLVFATSFGVLAVSFTRRHALPARSVALGAVGAPVLLGLVLFGIPALLGAFGLLPMS